MAKRQTPSTKATAAADSDNRLTSPVAERVEPKQPPRAPRLMHYMQHMHTRDLQMVRQLGLAALDDRFLRDEAMRAEALGISLPAPGSPPAPIIRAASWQLSPATVFAARIGIRGVGSWRELVREFVSNYQPPDTEAEAVTESTAAASSSNAASLQEDP